MSRTRLYRDGVLEASGFPVEEVSDHVADPSRTVWFDLCRPTHEQLAQISEELGLHPLAVEDVLHRRQRPKLDVYESHLFLTVYGERLDDGGDLDATEINVFVTRNALVTVRHSERFDIDDVVRRWDAEGHLAAHGVGFLLHGLLDVVVDQHFSVIEALDEQVERMEEVLFDDQGQGGDLQRTMFGLRKVLVEFRRSVLPMREVVNSLLRHDLKIVEPAMAPYYQDVHDHVLRVTEWADSLRDLLTNVRETHLTQQGYRLNDIVKRLTSWAAALYLVFRRRRWL